MIAGTVLLHPAKEKNVKPGYELVQDAPGKYSVYTVKGKKKTKMGEDLTPEQADTFRDKQKGRHKVEK